MINKNSGRRKWEVFFFTAVLFLILTFFSNTVLAAYDVTGVRPSAAMNPILGIAYGWPAILACAVANFASDLLSGYGIAVACLGFIPQIIYGALPFYAWTRYVGCTSRKMRLDSPKVTVCFAFLMAVNAAVIGLSVGAIQFFVSGSSFLESAFFVFQNNLCMCLIFGLPAMVLLDWVYSEYYHDGRRRLSVNEVIIAWSALVQLVITAGIIIALLISSKKRGVPAVWGEIFAYIGYTILAVMGIALVIMCYVAFLKKKYEGLRIFERALGTIYVDEKRNLEFLSFPDKAYDKVWRINLSCQRGCLGKCAFCDCPAFGFHGNASIEDLEYQIDTITSNTGSAATELMVVDFSRMGEPVFNDKVLEFIESGLCQCVRKKADAKVITPSLSTMMPKSGNTKDFLLEYCRIKNNVYDGNAVLHISIDSTDESIRRKMYGNRSLTIEEIAAIAETLPAPKGKKYALTFAVCEDSIIDAYEIDRLFDKSKFIIEITTIYQTFNAVDCGYGPIDELEIIRQEFTELGWEVTVCPNSKDYDDEGFTSGHLLLPNIREKLSSKPSGKKRIGLIVAIEMDAIFEHYKAWKELEAPPGFNLFLVERDTYDIYILQAGMGEIAASSGVQYLIAKYSVSYIVNFGVVGGLTTDMKTRKVCLVERVVHYKYDCSEFMDLAIGQVDGHDSIYLRTSESLVKTAMSAMEGLSLVTCCSGDKFIGTAEEKSYLHETFGGDICDMESAGIVLTCEANGVRCLLMKAVSDGLADGAEGFYAELQAASLKCLVATDTIMEHLAKIES